MNQATVIFLAGAGMGALVASVFLKDRYSKKYQKIADEKVDSMQEYVDKMRELGKKEFTLDVEKRANLDPQELKNLIVGDLTYLDEIADELDGADRLRESIHYILGTLNTPAPKPKTAETNKTSPVNYATAYSAGAFMNDAIENYKKYKSQYENTRAESEHPEDDEPEDDIQESWDETERRAIETKRKNDPPEEIEPFEYDDIPWHSKLTLVYYTEDAMLVNELDNEPVDDIEQLVGNVLETSGFLTDDKREEVFVRNWARGEDYNVYKYFGPFYD